MEIDEKIESIISFIEKIGFKEVYQHNDVDFDYKTGSNEKNLHEFRIFEKYISEYDRICFRIRRFSRLISIEKFYNKINVFHLKDNVKCFYLFDSDKYIEHEYDLIMKELNHKFKGDYRKMKIQSLL